MSDEEIEGKIDISPLIDCVFILLIFFIVTTVFVEETGIDVEKPQAASASNSDKTSIVLSLTKAGEVIYTEQNGSKRKIGVSGVAPLVRSKITAEQVPVVIQAHTKAKSGLLVRVIGEATAAGADTVSVAPLTGQG